MTCAATSTWGWSLSRVHIRKEEVEAPRGKWQELGLNLTAQSAGQGLSSSCVKLPREEGAFRSAEGETREWYWRSRKQ